jgi:hypothetical protein
VLWALYSACQWAVDGILTADNGPLRPYTCAVSPLNPISTMTLRDFASLQMDQARARTSPGAWKRLAIASWRCPTFLNSMKNAQKHSQDGLWSLSVVSAHPAIVVSSRNSCIAEAGCEKPLPRILLLMLFQNARLCQLESELDSTSPEGLWVLAGPVPANPHAPLVKFSHTFR